MDDNEPKSYVPEPYIRVNMKIKELEKKHNIRIIYVCEAYDREWGWGEATNKFNIGFIYVKPISEYLVYASDPSEITNHDFNDISFYGRDIKAVCGSIARSDAFIYEWLRTSIKYRFNHACSDLIKIAGNFYNPDRVYQNYKMSAINAIPGYHAPNTISITVILSIIRHVLIMNWIKEEETIPPNSIMDLLDGLRNLDLKEKFKSYIELMKSNPDIYKNKDIIDPDIKKAIIGIVFSSGDFDKPFAPSNEAISSLKEFCINTIKTIGNF